MPGRKFKGMFMCYSAVMYESDAKQSDPTHVERGGKIIMPASALDTLTRLDIDYPMQFKLVNRKAKRETHCGVLEFNSPEGSFI